MDHNALILTRCIYGCRLDYSGSFWMKGETLGSTNDTATTANWCLLPPLGRERCTQHYTTLQYVGFDHFFKAVG